MANSENRINLDDYEREKLETTKAQLQRIVDMIDLNIKMLEYCQDKEIVIANRPNLHDLRHPNGLVGPESDIVKLESKLENFQLSVLKGMKEEQIENMEEELSLRFTSDKKGKKKESAKEI